MTKLFEQAHYQDGMASFLQSAFHTAFFIPHLVVSEPPDKNLD
jgi:hypothetical protein